MSSTDWPEVYPRLCEVSSEVQDNVVSALDLLEQLGVRPDRVVVAADKSVSIYIGDFLISCDTEAAGIVRIPNRP